MAGQFRVSSRSSSRRRIVGGIIAFPVAAMAGAILSACAPATPPTATPAPKPATAPEKPAAPPAAQPATSGTPKPLNVRINKNYLSYPARLKEFGEKHPDYKITLEEVETDTRESWITGLIAGQVLSDWETAVVQVHPPRLLKKGIADKVLMETTEVLRPYMNLVPNMNYISFKGKYYGIPSTNAAAAWYYREDIYKEAGVNPDDLKTWDNVIDAGKKLKAKNDNYNAIILDTAGWNHLTMFTELNGGGMIDKDGNIIIDSKETIEAAQLYADLINKHKLAWTTATFYAAGTWQAYKDNHIVSAMMPDWYIGRFVHLGQNVGEAGRGKWKARLAPQFPGKNITSAQRGGDVALIAKGPNQERAAEFLVWSNLDKENDVKRLLEIDYMPLRMDSFEDKRVLDHENWFTQQKTMSVFGAAVKNMGKFYLHPNLQEIIGIVDRAVPKIAKGEVSAEQGLKAAAQEARALPEG